MRRYLTCLTLAAALLAPRALHAQSPTGPTDANWKTTLVGTVDMNRIFLSYYQSQMLDGELRAKRSHYQEMDRAKRRRVSEIATEGRRIMMALAQPELPTTEKHAFEQRRDMLEEEFQVAVKDADSYYRDKMQELLDFHESRRKALLEIIMAEVTKQAQAANLDILLDNSGPTYSNRPALVYSREMPDLTLSIIAELNKGHEGDIVPVGPTNADTLFEDEDGMDHPMVVPE